MRLNTDKINRLSHLIIDKIAAHPGVEFFDDRNRARLAIVKVIVDELKLDDQLDNSVKKRMSLLEKKNPEGSAEWELLYQKLYEEELNRKGRL
ncbi:MAG: DUF507 family protein [bacterium]